MITFDFHNLISALTHGFWAVMCLPAWYFLVKDVKHAWPFHVFMFTSLVCYGASFTFHSIDIRYFKTFLLIDHVGIFLLIAGTYTALIATCCKQAWVKMTIVWTGTAISTAIFILSYQHEVIHLAIGWGFMLVSYDLLLSLLRRDMLLMMLGGVIYTIGAMLEFGRVLGAYHHEWFHLFVMVGSICHYIFFWSKAHGGPTVCNEV
jgi:hemolysin III